MLEGTNVKFFTAPLKSGILTPVISPQPFQIGNQFTSSPASKNLMTSKRASFDRRDFLKTSALLGVGTAAVGNQGLSQTRTSEDSGETWFDKPMRWAQLVLVENDPGQYDPQFWLDYFKRTHSDAACLSAGGIVAYYPTKVPLHHRSAWMKDSDPFGELLAGCRKRNADPAVAS